MRRTAIAAGSIVAALAVGAVLAVSGGAQSPGARTVTLITKEYVSKTVDSPPRDVLGSGDRFLSRARVSDVAGARRGTFDIDCAVTRGGSQRRFLCDAAYVLAEGTIFVQTRFSSSAQPERTGIDGAVVGGTRAYAGARGTFSQQDRPADDDSADDVITLLP